MKKILTFVISIFISAIGTKAQESTPATGPLAEGIDPMEMPEAMLFHVDTLLMDWHAKHLLSPASSGLIMDTVEVASDSVYADRLARIPSVMDMPYNDVVRKYIDQYTGPMRSKVSYLLGAMNFYTPIFEEALAMYDLPNELKYLPVIESSLNPKAVSRAGAAGLWQFMVKTGKLYNLKYNSLVDERMDPVKSSFAAARYLKDLYGIYHDWILVIAAYNCGPGNVNKAIHRANGSGDYWEIYPYLPRETRGYVPAFIAANYIMNYYCMHNIAPMNAQLPHGTDTLHVSRNLHFQQVVDLCHVDMEAMRALNPQYRKDVVPGESMHCILRLPFDAVAMFIENGDSVYNHKAKELLSRRKYVDLKTSRKGGGGFFYHTIKNGETLGSIARKYGTTVKALREENDMRNNNIRAGKRLRIPQ
ncbi:MAG: transglycosylase SLT domain-containing protein [Bacteroidaceae bacterium]|nr:transglycosylase SLT domain-containing protein [Bacteroidaceae bacterium]